jgi:hypothetical protein
LEICLIIENLYCLRFNTGGALGEQRRAADAAGPTRRAIFQKESAGKEESLNKPAKIESETQLGPGDEAMFATEKDLGALLLSEIRSQDRLFRLNQPLRIEVSSFLGGWSYESKPLSILAFGRSRQEALASFMEDFSVLWDAIAQAPDEALTVEAIAVKYAFRQLVRDFTPE